MIDKELILYRKMTSAKYDGKRIRYWWYKRKYTKIRKKQFQNFEKKNK